jgi:hypoxanthine phosphoribosyltransferase
VEPDFASHVVFDEERIARRVRELGEEITADYLSEAGEAAELSIVSILKGGFIFLADLLRHIDLDLTVDFMAISSYLESGASAGGVKIVKDLSQSIYGRQVLVVEDIVDTGLTLGYILRNLATREPSGLKVCTLLDRAIRRIVPLRIDYCGFEIGDEYYVGYGLDHLQKWRNLKFICALEGLLPED